MKEQSRSINIQQAVEALNQGKVIAYPTESCYGLGCDPKNQQAIEKIIEIKSRSNNKGLILIAASLDQALTYVDIESSKYQQDIIASWPGPNTWLLPAKSNVLPVLRGEYPMLAIRVTAHPISRVLCQKFDGAIVSTSANLSGQPSLLDAETVMQTFGDSVSVLDGLIGVDKKPSTIRDGKTGEILRR